MTTEQNKALQAIIDTATKQLDTSHSYLGMMNCAIIHNARRALLELCKAEPKTAKKPAAKKARPVDFMRFAGRLAARSLKTISLPITIKDGKAIATDLDNWITFNTIHKEGTYILKSGVMLEKKGQIPDHPDMGAPVARITIAPDMLRKIYLAASVDETRRVINGVCIGEDGKGLFYCVGTDDSRLHLFERPSFSEVSWECILGHQTIKDLLYLCPEPFELDIYKKHVWIGGDGWGYMSRLFDGQYPNFRQVIQVYHPYTCTFDKAAILDQLKTVIVPYYKATEKKYSLRMSISQDAITCSMDGEQGRAFTVPCQSTGVTSACFNIEYLVDMLDGQPDAPVFHFSEPSCPMLLKGNGYTGVLMPMRLS